MEIREIGIVGSGTMGLQIAELFLKYGFNVTICSRNGEALRGFSEKSRQKGLPGKLSVATRIQDLKGRDFVIESIKEDLKAKQEIFEKLGDIAGSGTIIASNTSSIPIALIAKNCKNRHNIIGLHFSNPAVHMKIVEIAVPEFTSKETVDKILELVKKLGKDAVIVKDAPGFLLNRMLFVMLNEAANILNENLATKEEIDKAMVLGANHPIGPLKIIDLVGVDVTVDILKNMQEELKDGKYAPSPILLSMLKEKRLGRKTKKGFYDYQE
ncbi:3-hydroxyacyl-CoA dehydrogenase family protein [Candidatus Woesearchaeota archaeon]|nr:3-hydroxyacyl-CoA dehydrogenase family protein [Candidatus Woesearchaeota archaeon]